MEPSDRSAIDVLIRRYADIATRQAWSEYHEIVLPDAAVRFDFAGADRIDVTGAAGLGALGEAAVSTFAFYLYVPLNNVCEPLGEDRATGRAYALEVTADRAGASTDIFGVYDDDYARVEGRWAIAGRHYRELYRRTM